MTPKNIALEPNILERAEQVAQAQGVTVDELATKAMERELARLWLQRIGREAQVRRGNMTDEEVESIVEQAIQEYRAEQRGR
jgi:isopropylmalate/homocitrate/citramalate synthase